MKKILKVSGIVILILIVLMIVLPFIFKGRIVEEVKKEINNNVNAKVDFTDFSLSLFRSFPNFSFGLENLTVIGLDAFEDDTLASVPSFYLTIDLFSVIGGSSYPVKKISIQKPRILLKVLEDGSANWDIVKETEDTEELDQSSEPSAFKLELKMVEINDASLIYDDASLMTIVKIKHLDHKLKGDLSADLSTLYTKTNIKQFSLNYEGIKYFNKAELDIILDLVADIANDKYSFNEGDIRINNLFLAVVGSVSLLESGYGLDIIFKAKENSFKNFLSLIPAVYAKDFNEVKTEGKLALDGFVKGVYDEERMPGFGLKIKVDKAMFKYPDLPKAIKNINIQTNIVNPDGNPDNTIIDITDFHFEIEKNMIDIQLLVKTPETDPQLKGQMTGHIDLSALKDAYPLEEGTDLNGILNADIRINGNISSIENEQYKKFNALGNLSISNMNYVSNEFPQGFNITEAKFIFSPKFLILVSLDSKLGKSDLKANGKIFNYLSYFFNEELLSGNFNITSNLMDLNEFITESDEESSSSGEAASDEISIIEVPANIDFIMTASFNELLYDKLVMKNVIGALRIKDQQLKLMDLKMNVLEGQMLVNGVYETVNPEQPTVDFDLDIQNMDIQKAAGAFVTMKKIAPIVAYTKGRFSTKMKYKTLLDKEMMPVLNSISGSGNLKTTKVTIEGVPVLDKLSEALQMDKFRRMSLDEVNLSFEFFDGKVYTKPFKIKQENIMADVSGTTSFDQSIDYIMNLHIPRSEFGGGANNMLDKLVANAGSKGLEIKPGQVVNIDVLIGGCITDPKIKTGLKGAMDDVLGDIKEKAKDEFEKKKAEVKANIDSLKNEAEKRLKEEEKKAKAEAERLKKEAEEKAKAEAERLKKEAEEKAKKEAEEAKKKLEEEAKNKLKKLF
ncbi:AsmA-like C-terminal region-containing protein [candidate division KSB1 bacterium]